MTEYLRLAICPGFHDPSLTEQFVRSLPAFVRSQVIEAIPADPIGVFYQLSNIFDEPHTDLAPIVAIGFSAGVVGLAGALNLWQQQGGKVARFFAVDGWGVPVIGLPICRLSHDAFTHWSSLPLGAGNVNFYAEPAVDHLEIWGKSSQVSGWQVEGWQPGGTANSKAMTAADFLARQLQKEWDYVERRS